MKNHSLFKQQGLSLVELMISITLGMVLMGAALQVMVSNNKTYKITDDVSRIQENGRIALDILVKDLRLAGYRQPLNGDGKPPNYVLKECAPTPPADPFDDPCAQDGINLLSDQLSVQFDPPPDDGTETTCLGEVIPATDIIVNVYTVEDADNDGINSLYCRAFNASTGVWTAAAKQPIIDGIDHMQLLYGIAGDATNPDSTTKYAPLSTVQADDSWENIRSIRVALLVSNGLAEGSSDQKERRYRVLDNLQPLSFTDRHSRRIYSTTVHFNNKLR
ncbi:MAG: PilW family protein [Spongiibacteraceae bacterium]|nr:PilW family protein [Spongiibacteraceae bacterium]